MSKAFEKWRKPIEPMVSEPILAAMTFTTLSMVKGAFAAASGVGLLGMQQDMAERTGLTPQIILAVTTTHVRIFTFKFSVLAKPKVKGQAVALPRADVRAECEMGALQTKIRLFGPSGEPLQLEGFTMGARDVISDICRLLADPAATA